MGSPTRGTTPQRRFAARYSCEGGGSALAPAFAVGPDAGAVRSPCSGAASRGSTPYVLPVSDVGSLGLLCDGSSSANHAFWLKTNDFGSVRSPTFTAARSFVVSKTTTLF